LEALGESASGTFAGAPLTVSATAVTLQDVIPISDFEAPAAELAAALRSGHGTSVDLRPGASFGVSGDGGSGEIGIVYRVASCQATDWFPCR
jgi:hypothetical protein